MKHAILSLLLFVLVGPAGAQAGGQPQPTPPQEPEPVVEPAEDDPRRGIATRDFRDSLPTDNRVRDRRLAPGIWRAWLELPSGHELALTLDLEFQRDHFRDGVYGLQLRNGTESLPAEFAITSDQESLEESALISFPESSARIEADFHRGSLKLTGEFIYERMTDGVSVEYRLPFTAVNGDGRRYDTPEPTAPEPPASLPDNWRVTFESRQGPAVMALTLLPDGRHVQGTVSTPTGDDGVLFGVFHEGRLRLSRFTGGGGLLYEATMQPDGSMIGTFHSLGHHSETFTATPARDAALPDLFEQTRWLDGVDAGDLAFRDSQGTERRIDTLAPGPGLLYIFGTWCHNCSDATAYLKELHAKHGDSLPIAGIAFESPDDFEAQAERVKRYAERRDVPFPLLVAGQRNKSSATEVLGALDRVRAYPTFVFLDAQGEVAAVHQGFIGPADPGRHQALRDAFDDQINAILNGG